MVLRQFASLVAFGGLLGPAALSAQEPLSAIDWLTPSVVTAAIEPIAQDKVVVGAITKGPIADNALPQAVTVTSLDQSSLDGAGLLTPAKTGLPAALWGNGKTSDILLLLQRQNAEALPALQGLLLTLILAESVPPNDAGAGGTLLLGRIDKLLDMGALDQAMALLQTTGEVEQPELFRRLFNIALLTGAEDRACRRLTQSPSLSPALPARIFCLARNGDWQTAAILLQTAQALGQIPPDETLLLTSFLDPAFAETGVVLAPPTPITPLDLRMFEAIGEPLPINALPIAFAHSDLSETTGWKARLEAAERLSRAGAIAPNLLLGYYTQQKPAASGGVWDRVKAFQTFETALGTGDVPAITAALGPAMTAMESAELEVVFSELFAARLGAIALSGPAADLRTRLQLLSAKYEKLTAGASTADETLAFALAIARGKPAGAPTPNGMARAIAAGWAAPELPADIVQMLAEKRAGELILTAIERISNGAEGQLTDVTLGLAVLRKLGMEDAARRAALQLLLLERRG